MKKSISLDQRTSMKRTIICCCHICGEIFAHETEFMSSPLAFDVTDATGSKWTVPCRSCGRDSCDAQLNDAWLDPKHAVWKAAAIQADANAKPLVFDLGRDYLGGAVYRLIVPPFPTGKWFDEGPLEHARRAGKVG